MMGSWSVWRWWLVGAVTLSGALVLLGGNVSAQREEGAFAVDCEGNTLEVDTDCQFGDGQEFAVLIQFVEGLDEPYAGIQIKLDWDAGVIEYLPTEGAGDEVVWQECTIPARNSDLPDGPSLIFACVPFTGRTDQPLQPSTYVGPLFYYSFRCVGTGTATLRLAPLENDQPLGTHVITEDNETVVPELRPARVTCGGPAAERPAPEVTPGIEPIVSAEQATMQATPPEVSQGDETPPAERTPGAQGPSTPTGATPAGEGATGGSFAGDKGGGGFPVWAWALIGVGAVAGLGAIGGYGWWRARGG